MAFANPDLQIMSNCKKFTVQVFGPTFQINKLTTEGTFLKLGRITPSEFSEIVLPLINNACKAINNKPIAPVVPAAVVPAVVKTITRKKKQDTISPVETATIAPAVTPVIDMEAITAAITANVIAAMQSQTPAVIQTAVTPAKTDKLSNKSRIHMINILRASGVKIAKNITDSALRLLYADLKG